MRLALAWQTRVLGLLVAPSVVTSSAPAQGAMWVVAPSDKDIERARELYENGVSLFDEGSYEGAALAFERAYELSEDNNLLYNIALAYDRNGEFETAIAYLDRYRALAPKSERASLERRKKSLVKRLEKQREDEANAPLELDPEPDPDPDSLDDDSLEDEPPAPPPRKPRRFPPLAWALTGTAVLGFGLGTGFGVASLTSSRTGREGCTERAEALYCQSSSGDELQRGRTHALVADVSLAVGAAATVGVVIVVAVTAARRKKTAGVTAVPMATPTSAGLALIHRF